MTVPKASAHQIHELARALRQNPERTPRPGWIAVNVPATQTAALAEAYETAPGLTQHDLVRILHHWGHTDATREMVRSWIRTTGLRKASRCAA